MEEAVISAWWLLTLLPAFCFGCRARQSAVDDEVHRADEWRREAAKYRERLARIARDAKEAAE